MLKNTFEHKKDVMNASVGETARISIEFDSIFFVKEIWKRNEIEKQLYRHEKRNDHARASNDIITENFMRFDGRRCLVYFRLLCRYCLFVFL